MTVQAKAFLLRPDTPKEGKVRELRPGESPDQLSEPLRTYAQEAGLVMCRPPLISYTMDALEATEYACEQGRFDPFHRGLYKAYWEQGSDLGDLEVIRAVAEECGLDWPELKERLTTGSYRDAVTGQYQEAMKLGIRGIPAFLIGNTLFTGARPYEVFKVVVETVLERDAAGQGT